MVEFFERAQRLPENQDPAKQFAIRQAYSLFCAAEVKDPDADLCRESDDPLANLRESTAKEREVLEKIGFVFLPIEAKPLGQVFAENEEYFGHASTVELSRPYTPPQFFEAAIDLRRPRISQSINRSQARQLIRVDQYSMAIKAIVPEAKAIMLPATGLAQVDIGFQKRNKGKVLIRNFWARALDKMVGASYAIIGRDRPDAPLSVHEWPVNHGYSSIAALAAVVFPK